MDVSEALRILRRHSEHLGSLEAHLLDIRALTGIARVVGLQSANLRFQSSSLFVDPETAKQKVEALSRQQLSEFFLLSWHPIVELEQLTPTTVKEALEYWEVLLSFFERRRRLELGPLAMPGSVELSDLSRAGLMEDKAFTKRLNDFWEELKEKASPDNGIEYWSFVKASRFAETVTRAQFVSFLVTYGYATMEKMGKKLVLSSREKPQPPTQGPPLSFPIAIPKEAS
ncbi:MAG TPA: hypothetical protein VIK88_03230 [Candidatus Bathyarchaeia archaeon]